MKQIKLNIQIAFQTSNLLFISFLSILKFATTHYNRISAWSLYLYLSMPGVKEKKI